RLAAFARNRPEWFDAWSYAAPHDPDVALIRAELAVYRDVSLAVMARMGEVLGWSRARGRLLAAGIHAAYRYERVLGWRRMVSLAPPERRDPLGGPATTAPEFA
ncbi:hypothetical protein ADL35_08240, partial [Streptomyces sp. NRRL WC-3753]